MADKVNGSSSKAVAAIGLSLCLLAAACGGRRDDADSALARANIAALEASVDMASESVDSDDKLEFNRTDIYLGDIPLGQTRRAEVTATNRTDDSLVVLDATTSCSCTKVAFDRKPVPAEGTIKFVVDYTADTEGVFFKKIAVRHSAAARPVSFTIRGAVVKP